MCVFLDQNVETVVQGASTPADRSRSPPGDGSLLSPAVSLAGFQQQTFAAVLQQTRLDNKLLDVRNGGRISLITAGGLGILGVAAALPAPPTLLRNAAVPLCACLVSLHFSLSVSDLASFLLSLFHSDSPEGKLISTV